MGNDVIEPVEGRIISVPHSGTRTLCEVLGHVDFMPRQYHYWHFGMNDADILAYGGIAHIPLRDPFDMSMSWEVNYPHERSKDSAIMLRQLDLMLEYVVGRPQVEYHRVDKFKLKRGKGPEHWCKLKKNRDKAVQLDRSIDLFRWWRQNEKARTFYAKHFPEGFWWE